MSYTLVLTTGSSAFADDGSSNDPQLNAIAYKSQLSIAVENPKTEVFKVLPGATISVFSGTRTTSIDNTTTFTLSLNPALVNRYRFTATAGTTPAFRTDRALTLSGVSVAITVNSNQTATFTAVAGSFTGVVAGDIIFVPGVTTGDSASPFGTLNEGEWVVLSVAGDYSSIQVGRQTSFMAATVTATPSTNSQMIAYSAAGVQVGDLVSITAGFAAPVLQNYKVVQVTPTWFEVLSTVALPVTAVGTPTATGIAFYSSAKRYVRILSDAECVPLLNGDTSNTNQITPWLAGNKNYQAEFVKVGPVWSLSLKNISSSAANITVLSAE